MEPQMIKYANYMTMYIDSENNWAFACISKEQLK